MIWENIYNVGIEEIDKQHKMFVETLNKLFEAVQNSSSKDKLEIVFKELDGYIKYHFATEEKYFDMFSFDESENHKAKHNDFKNQIAIFKEKIDAGELHYLESLITYLEDWLANHIMEVDKRYVPCFKANGLK